MIGKNYYKTLDLEPGASSDDIKNSYRDLARKFHPDSGGSGKSEERFQEIHEAYLILSDEKKRQKYDRINGFDRKSGTFKRKEERRDRTVEKVTTRHMFQRYGTTQSASQSFAGPAGARFKDEPETVAKELSGAVSSFFKKFTVKRDNSKKLKPHKKPESAHFWHRDNRDFQKELDHVFTIDAVESLHGAQMELAIETDNEPRMLRVRVPAGVKHGAILKVKVPNQGEVKIRVNITPHKFVEREGYNIIVKIPITIAEAINGVELHVPTLQGSVKVRIPPRGEKEKKLRLKGRGVHHVKDNIHGDLYVQTYVVIPENPSQVVLDAANAIEAHYPNPVRKDLPSSL